MKKLLCFIICSFLICSSVCPIFALGISSSENSSIGNMERVTDSVPFDFEIVSVGRDSVTAAFVSTGRIADPPYVGIKGTKTVAEKTSALQYVLNYDTEYSFVYTVTEGDVKTVYNSFITVETDGTPAVVFGDVIKNIVDPNSTRGAGQITETEPNDNMATADITFDDFDNYGTMAVYNNPNNPSIAMPGDTDYWKVTFNQAGSANFWLGNIPSGCDYDISLCDENGIYIAASANYGQTDELIQANVEAYKSYYIAITSYGSVVSSSQYLFRTKNYPPVVPPPPEDVVVTFVLYDLMTGLYTGLARIEYRGEYDNNHSCTRQITGLSGNPVGINIRVDGYHTYVSPTTMTFEYDTTIEVTLYPLNDTASSCGFTHPISPSYPILSPFGWRSWEHNGIKFTKFGNHYGNDYSVVCNTPVLSVCEVSPLEFKSYPNTDSRGNYVVVTDIESGKTITYMHLESRPHPNGLPSTVAQGAEIAKSGNTGNSDGPHLHIQIEDFTFLNTNATAQHDAALYLN